MTRLSPRFSRRQFGMATGALASTAIFPHLSSAEERPTVVDPRATWGDARHQPKWDEMLTVTVGPEKAQIVGLTEKSLQGAVDYLARLGGGTVRILPGTYRLRNSVFLPSKIRLLGAGEETVLRKEDAILTALASDSDWYDQEVTLVDAKGFQLGDGICFQSTNHDGGPTVLKRTLVARSGNRFKLDRPLSKDLWIRGKATASTLFPLIAGVENARDIHIENLTLDGNRANNPYLNGNHAGCIFLKGCNRITIQGVTARNFNGDGMSWQVCHDVVVQDCRSFGHAGLGLHPGSGSQRSIVRKNRLTDNDLGLFFCWGVRFAVVEENFIDANRSYGISIGHCDTDNLIRNNEIRNSGKVGILFRDDSRGKDFWPHRNRIIENRILNNGPADGVAVDVRGKTRDVVLESNQIEDSRGPQKRIGVRLGKETRNIRLEKNKIQGFAVDIKGLSSQE